MPFTLEHKAALVTGAGRGIGRAIAEKLAAAGAAVMINDLDPDPASETENAIKHSGGLAAHLAGDVTAPDFPQKLVDATLAAFGGLDIIVNNAGYTWDNVIQKTTDEQFQAMLDIHLVAPFRILRAASALHPRNRQARRPPKAAASCARWSTSLRSPAPTATPVRPAIRRARPASSASPRPWPRSGAATT